MSTQNNHPAMHTRRECFLWNAAISRCQETLAQYADDNGFYGTIKKEGVRRLHDLRVDLPIDDTETEEEIIQKLWDGDITLEWLFSAERHKETERIYFLLRQYLPDDILGIVRTEILKGRNQCNTQ